MKRAANGKPNNTKSYGNKLGFAIFGFILKTLGLRFAYVILILLLPYYLIFRPSVYRRAKPYLQRRFPGDSPLGRYFRMFEYIYSFGRTLIDQFYFGLADQSQIKLEFDREAEVLALLDKGPVVFLMSHVGYWEVAMAGSMRFNKKMNVLVNPRFDKDKRQSFYDLQEHRFKLINVTDYYGGMIEATNALLREEAVAVTGDRAEQWRTQTVTFLGAPAKFPVIAEQLALATGASVIALFAAKGAGNTLCFRWKDISSGVLADPELDKEAKIGMMLENYARELENHLREYPYAWFNFFDFWQD